MTTPPSRPRRRKTVRGRILVGLVGTATALLLAEISVRAVVWLGEGQRAATWRSLSKPSPAIEHGEAKLGHIIRMHDNSRIVYELIPDIAVTFMGQPVRVNADGFRGPSYSRAPAAGTFRVVGLGDSVMFGWGVREEDSFLRQLEGLLNERHPDRRYEAINTAVPGYNTVMEVETLVAKGLAWRPDVVVLDLVGNDMDLPNFIAREPDYFTLSTSFLAEFVASIVRGWDTQLFRPLALSPKRDAGNYENDPEKVPEEYRELVGFEPFAGALRRLKSLSESHGFAVLVTTHLGGDERVRGLCAELGFPFVETLPAVERHQREHGIDGYMGTELTVSAEDPHPSAILHRLQAEAIYERMVAEGLTRPR